jgi:hypothetical protein
MRIRIQLGRLSGSESRQARGKRPSSRRENYSDRAFIPPPLFVVTPAPGVLGIPQNLSGAMERSIGGCAA